MSAPLLPGVHLVTGGAGYFGSLLARALHRRGARVRVFDRAEAGGLPPEVETLRGDIRDADAVARALGGVAAVYHCVAQVPLAKDRALFWSVNRDGTRVLLEQALAARVQKVVNVSSSAVYGAPRHNPVTEESPREPGEAYGRAKLAGEALCDEFARRGLDVSIIRPRTVMGHGRLGIMQLVFEWVRQGQAVPVLGEGHNRYQFIHADDLAEACIRAAQRPGPAAYNVGTDRFGTMRQTLEGLIRHAGSASRVVSLPLWPAVVATRAASALGLTPLGAYHALMYGRELWFDLGRARAELGFAPARSNVEMFCESYDWYLAHRDEVLARRGSSPHASALAPGLLDPAVWLLTAWARWRP